MKKGCYKSLKRKNAKGNFGSKVLSAATLAGLMLFGANAANADENYGSSYQYADGIITGAASELVPEQGTLDVLHESDPEAYPNGSAYSIGDSGVIPITQYEIDSATKGILDTHDKYIDILQKTYANGTINYSWDDENYKLNTTISGAASKGTKSGSNYNGDFVGNNQGTSGSVLYNSNSSLDTVRGNFIGNSYNYGGGAVYNNSYSSGMGINAIFGNFVGNSSINSSGGAIYNYTYSDGKGIKSIVGDFIANSSTYSGGAIYNYSSGNNPGIETIVGDFIANSVSGTGGVAGGAISHAGVINAINGNFINNAALYLHDNSYVAQGGAIATTSNNTINNIKGNFIGNRVLSKSTGSYPYYAALGGAISNSANQYSYTSLISEISGNFVGNYVDAVNTALGGAISNFSRTYYSGYTSSITINNIKSDFIGNHVKSANATALGGAISNYFYQSQGAIQIGNIEGDFVGNYAISESTQNSSYSQGGAIANFINAYYSSYSPTITINKIKGSFIENYISSKGANSSAGTANYGGAISNNITRSNGNIHIGTIEGNFIGNKVLKDSVDNYMANHGGGAISNFVASYDTSQNPTITIDKIEGDFIGNSTISTDRSEGGAIFNESQGWYGSSSIGEINGNYINNVAKGQETFGGAIYSDNAGIGCITGNFISNMTDDSNGSTTGGGAIFNGGTISDINGNFKNNTAKSNRGGYGGAIFNLVGTIGNITGNFDSNTVNGQNYDTVSGGAISNANGSIKNIIGDFTNNSATSLYNYAQGGAIGTWGLIASNADDAEKVNVYQYTYTKTSTGETVTYWNASTKTSIDNAIAAGKKLVISLYSNSYQASDSQWDNIQNNIASGTYITTDPTSTLTDNDIWHPEGGIINTNFLNNYAKGSYSNTNTHGGAIYLSSLPLNLIADGNVAHNSGISKISGNYIQIGETMSNEAIYVGTNASLNFIAQNNGQFIIDDYINGEKDNYLVTFKGDDTGRINLYNDVKKGAVSVAPDGETLTMNLANDDIHDYEFGSLNSNSNAKWYIDVNVDEQTADNITTTLSGSSGTVTLYGLNVIAGDFDTVTDQDFNIQVLKTQNDDLQLALSDELAGDLDTERLIGTNVTDNYDYVQAVTKWDDTYFNHQTTTEVYGTIGLTTKDTTNDSIGMNISRTESATVDIPLETLTEVNNAAITQRTFEANNAEEVYSLGDGSAQVDIGTTAAGELSIIGQAEGDKRSTIDFQNNKGFTLNNDDTTLTLKDVKLTNSSQAVSSNNENSVINLDNAELSGNENGILTKGTVNISGGSIIKEDIILSGDNASVNINDTNEVDLDARIIGNEKNKLSINNSTLDVKQEIIGVNTILNNATVNLPQESLLLGNLTVDTPSHINIENNAVGNLNFNNITLNGDLGMKVDADLANQKMDTISAATATVNGGSINVEKINILSPTTEPSLSLLFTNNKDLAGAVSYSGNAEIAYSPIYLYDVSYDKIGEAGYFSFVRHGIGSKNSSESFNPAVLTSPVATQAAAQTTMNYGFNYAFEHAYSFTTMPASVRQAKIKGNEIALSTDFNNNIDLNKDLELDHTNKAIWVKPYTSFEKLNLHDGPKVDMISYGTIIGGDSEFRKLRNGWTNVGTLYIGYNGSSIDYNDVDMTTNGGMLGVTETFYKNNFFTAITAQAGAGFAQANTMYGKDEMTSIMGGIASKTGYNFEFKEGKFVIQPNLMLNYSMVKTLDYTNAAGVRINSDPLHTIQINPTIRFIANLNHGWQPYFNVGMVWNVMNNSHVTANGVKLPNTYTKPYVEYGVGVQKHIGEKFSGYAQAMVRNGGRNGVALTAGFRWALGSSKKSEKSVEKTKSEQKISSLPNNNSGVNTTKQKTVIKSLNSTKSRNIARYMAMIEE